MAKKLITLAFGLILIWLLVSCGSAYHLRRAEHHIKKAEKKGAKWTVDTTYHTVKFKVDPVKVKFEPRKLVINDTMFFEKEKVVTRIVVKNDTVHAETDCPEIIVEKKVPVTVVKTIEAKQFIKWWWLLVAIAVGFLVGVFLIARKR